MSTCSIIATGTTTDWHGVYVHSDGYPSGVGEDLFKLFHNTFERDHVRMINELIETKVCGWSCTGTFPAASYSEHGLNVKRWIEIVDKKAPYPDEAVYYDGERANTHFITELTDTWCEWLYLLHPNQPFMFVYKVVSGNDSQDELEFFCAINLATDSSDALYESDDEDEDE